MAAKKSASRKSATSQKTARSASPKSAPQAAAGKKVLAPPAATPPSAQTAPPRTHGKPKLGPLHGGVAPLFMMAQVPFNQIETVELNTPMIQIMDDVSNVGVLTSNLKELGVWELMLAEGSRTLEIGCGSGYMLEALSEQGKGVYEGFEPIASEAAKAVERLTPRLGAAAARSRVQTAVLEDAAVPAAKYDVIYSYHVFEHLENPLVMLHKAKLWLKPGGVLVITCPNVEGALPARDLSQWRCALPSHRWLPGLKAVRRILETEGFRVVAGFTYGGYPAPRAWWQSLANRWFKARHLGDVMCLAAVPRP